MRTIAFVIVFAELVLLAPLYAAYGQVDPCCALAKEIADRAETAGGLGVAVKHAFARSRNQRPNDIADRSTRMLRQTPASWTERARERSRRKQISHEGSKRTTKMHEGLGAPWWSSCLCGES